MNREPDCELVRRWISLVEDQELSAERAEILESHLDHCSRCRSWNELFHRGMDALDFGVDKVSGEIDEILNDTLDPDILAPPSEPIEIARAADRAAPRLAALAAGVLILISVFAWGVFSDFSKPTWLYDSEGPNNWSLESSSDVCRLTIDGEEHPLDQQGSDTSVEFGQTLHCLHGSCEFIDRAGRTISISEGTVFIPRSQVVVRLIDGRARFDVPRGMGEFEVVTAEATVSVMGTVFEVQRWASSQRTEVRVEEGSVAVTRGGRVPLPLHVGERVEVTSRGLMFHAARTEREGEKPLPRARLGVVKPRAVEVEETPAPTDPGASPEQRREEGNAPLDLPVNQRQGVDPDDGED